MANIAAVEHHVSELQQALLDLARHTDLRDERASARFDRLAEEGERTSGRIDRLAEAGEQASASIDRLVEAGERTSARIDRLAEAGEKTSARIDRLAEAGEKTSARIDRLAEAGEKTSARIDRLAEAGEKTSARIDRLAEAGEKTSARIDRLAEQGDRTSLELDRLSSEMREFKDETRKANADLRDSLNRQSAELSRTLGTLAEDILGPSIPTLFKRFFPGDEPEFAMRALKRHKTTRERREFDTPAWNDRVFLVSETKARLRPDDLDGLAETIAEVRNFFPEAEGKRVCAALASLYIDPSLVTAGERRGYLMIALGNNLAEVMNSVGFKPAEF